MGGKYFYCSQGRSKSYLPNYHPLVKTNWEGSQEYTCRIEREKNLAAEEQWGLIAFQRFYSSK